MSQSTTQHFPVRALLSLLALCLPIIILYSQFLWNPIVFDDNYFFDGTVHNQYLDKIFSFDLRWLPYATFEWTRSLLGLDLIWFHLGNLLIHLATTISLFLFLRRLFEQVLPGSYENSDALAAYWLAFFAALIFALHPASVYAVAYLSQRSILMAMLFTLFTWRLFLEGLIRKNQFWLLGSAATYLLAVLSKEHAVMAPAISVVLLLLISSWLSRQWLILVRPTMVLYGLIGLFVVFQIKTRHILGQAYEPMVATLVPKLGIDNSLVYPLSVLTQCFLYFKYIGVWLVPSPAWMSVDIYQHFAQRLISWPEIVGLIGFIIYPILATHLLLKKGIKGLLGFALLCPWLLFATELSTIRIQESFVLYRSYLWMAGAFAALPFLCQKLTAKQASVVLLMVALFMMPLSWLRLRTFSHPLLLWDDAARLVEHSEEYYPGMERIFYNRGNAFNHQKQYAEAINDYTLTIRLAGKSGYLTHYAYNNRASAYLDSQQYQQALDDFTKTIELNPEYTNAYLGKALALENLNQYAASAEAYKVACSFGNAEACRKIATN